MTEKSSQKGNQMEPKWKRTYYCIAIVNLVSSCFLFGFVFHIKMTCKLFQNLLNTDVQSGTETWELLHSAETGCSLLAETPMFDSGRDLKNTEG